MKRKLPQITKCGGITYYVVDAPYECELLAGEMTRTKSEITINLMAGLPLVFWEGADGKLDYVFLPLDEK